LFIVNGAVYLNGALISSSGTISFTNATLYDSTVDGIAERWLHQRHRLDDRDR
jgi:hypothetical protein